MSAVEVRDLRVELSGTGDEIVDGVSFAIDVGEVLGLVGESGSGKTTVGTALLGYMRRGARIAGGTITIDGVDILGVTQDRLRELRGRVVAYIPQDPASALNPALRIRRQLEEALIDHGIGGTRAERVERIRSILTETRLPTDDAFLSRYPHQLSGGQQQRVCIAMAFLCEPRVIVLDEPTTGLDVTTQAHVLALVRDLCANHGVAALYVTHDLAVVANLANRVMVMYGGRVVELGSQAAVFGRPGHPYTQKLLGAIPDVEARHVLATIPGRAPAPGDRPGGCSFAARCELVTDACRAEPPPVVEIGAEHVVRCLRSSEVAPLVRRPRVWEPPTSADVAPLLAVSDLDAFYGTHHVLRGVSFEVGARECVALVGESGSGKSTLSRAVIGLMPDWSGTIAFRSQPLATHARQRPADTRRLLQYVFQSPYNSLNPRQTVAQIVTMPLEHFDGLKGRAARSRVEDALTRVSLSARVMDRFPDQLSGGERQRVAIARALVCDPDLLICDEITSALDVSVQAAIVELLEELREQTDLSLLFVTHNLALVRNIADRTVVLHDGRVVETGATAEILEHPSADYTRQLLDDTPRIVTSTA